MYWTLELASYLEDAPWPATRDELVDYSIRSGAPLEVIENLQALDEENELYEGIEDIWPDYPRKDDFFFNEDEYWKCSYLTDTKLVHIKYFPLYKYKKSRLGFALNETFLLCVAIKNNVDGQIFTLFFIFFVMHIFSYNNFNIL